MLAFISFGYLCGGVATSFLASGSWRDITSFYRSAASDSVNPNESEVYIDMANNIPLAAIFATCITVSVSLLV